MQLAVLTVLYAVSVLPGTLALQLPQKAGGMSELPREQAQVCHWPTHLGLHRLTISIRKYVFQF